MQCRLFRIGRAYFVLVVIRANSERSTKLSKSPLFSGGDFQARPRSLYRGNTASDPNGNVAGLADVRAQTRYILETIKMGLEAAHSTLQNVRLYERVFHGRAVSFVDQQGSPGNFWNRFSTSTWFKSSRSLVRNCCWNQCDCRRGRICCQGQVKVSTPAP